MPNTEVGLQEQDHLYRVLRQRAGQGESLTADEVNTLAQWERATETADELRLATATARVEQDTRLLAEQNAVLRDVLERKQQLAERLETMLMEVRAEQERMNAQIARFLQPDEAALLAAGKR